MINLKCTFAVTAGLCSSLAYAQNQPHIILIMTDQQRGDAMGCMGNESVISPHLDALASEGTLFMNGYSSCPSSTPARAGLLTGQSPWHHGLLGYGKVAPKYNHEMPHLRADVALGGRFDIGDFKAHALQRSHAVHDGMVLEGAGDEVFFILARLGEGGAFHSPVVGL